MSNDTYRQQASGCVGNHAACAPDTSCGYPSAAPHVCAPTTMAVTRQVLHNTGQAPPRTHLVQRARHGDDEQRIGLRAKAHDRARALVVRQLELGKRPLAAEVLGQGYGRHKALRARVQCSAVQHSAAQCSKARVLRE